MPNLKEAARNLMKGISNLSVKYVGDPYIAEGQVIVPSAFRSNAGNPGWFFGPNGVDYKFVFDGPSSAGAAYERCPPLAAVINRKAQAYINGKTLITDSNGKEVKNEQANKIRKLLSKPNFLQSWRSFEAQQYIYTSVFGWCAIMPIHPSGFNTGNLADASAMWLIPPYMLDIQESDKLFYQADLKNVITSMKLTYKELDIKLDPTQLFYFRDFTPSFNSMVFPGSRIKALQMPINNVIAAYESRNELINYAGSQGILTPKTDNTGPIPLKEGEKEQLQADFKRQYGIKRGQSRYIISPAAMDWQAMGRPTKDLMLFEEVEDDIMRICDGYVYPSPLLNSSKGPAVANTKEFKAQVYTDAIIPESIDFYEQWSNAFKLNDGDSKLFIKKDYDHIPVLKSDQVEDGRAAYYLDQSLQIRWLNNVITLNQWREESGQETVPAGDIYYYQAVAAGMVSSSPKPTDINPNDNGNQEPSGPAAS